MYKLVAIDIDDTLLTDDMKITAKTRRALEQAIGQGVIVTLATGRMYASAKLIAGQLALNVPIITYQGSLVKKLLDEQVIYERSVPEMEARMIFEYAKEHGLHLQAYHNDILLVKEDNRKIKHYAKLLNIPYTVVPDFDKWASKPLTKLLIIDDPDRLDEIKHELTAVLGGNVHLTKSKPNYLEFLHPEGTKGHAVRYLADHFGIGIDQVIAIGDSWNDREMLEAAGLGVAMGNAIPALKEIADYVTLSNNDEGVTHVFEKFVLA